MLNIEYCNGGSESTGSLLRAAFQLIPEYWRAHLPSVRVVVSGEPLACVQELADDIERFLRGYRDDFEEIISKHTGDTPEDEDYRELASEALAMENVDGYPFDGEGDNGVWVPRGFNPPAIFVHQGKRSEEQIMKAFLGGCGHLLAGSETIKEFLEQAPMGLGLEYAGIALHLAFDDFCLSLTPVRPLILRSRKSSRFFIQHLLKLDAMLNPNPASGTSGTA